MTDIAEVPIADPAIRPSEDIAALLAIMARLRDPAGGCPWDLQQDFRSIVPYTIEEAYEVADAVERGAMAELQDELGDLLLQVVFHAQMASETGAFRFGDVVMAITSKMIRRHPHVFGEASAANAGGAKASWDKIKAEEKAQRRSAARPDAWLDDVPLALPGLSRAQKLQKRAAEVGFDWGEVGPVLAKIDEEMAEFRSALDARDAEAQQDEFGDLLFSLVNLGRHLGIDAEDALRRTNDKFRRRFDFVERSVTAAGSDLKSATLAEMERFWEEAKSAAASR